ncbi:hypothetical protein SAMN04487758_102118 [Enterococcus mundtii]|nr:hypothetical protein SAMN04487758_102118 [Enterococcus mundtii]
MIGTLRQFETNQCSLKKSFDSDNSIYFYFESWINQSGYYYYCHCRFIFSIQFYKCRPINNKPKPSKMKKPFSMVLSYYSVLNASFTTQINSVRKPAPSIVSQNLKKYEGLFSQVLPYYLELNGFLTT